MKKIIIYLLLLCSLQAVSQTNGSTKFLFVNGVAVKPRATAPDSPVEGDFWIDSSSGFLKIYHSGSWVSQGSIATNLAIGTITATTIPVTNSNGTGFTIPQVTSSLAGVMSASDKSKLDGITGTNTGNQDISIAEGGRLSISAGSTIILSSLGLGSRPNGLTLPAQSGLFVDNISGGSNYPTGTGMVASFFRTASSTQGAFRFVKAVTNNSDIYFQTGNGSGGWNTEDIIAGKAYVSSTYAPLASPALTGTPTAPTAAPGTNTTQIATMAAIAAAASNYAKISGSNNFSGNQNVLGNISVTDGTTFNGGLQSYTFSGPGQGSRLALSNRNTSLSNTIFTVLIQPDQSQQADITLRLPKVAGTFATLDDTKQDTLFYAGGGSLSTIPSTGKKRVAVVGSITYVNTNLPATASIGDTFTLMGELNSLSGTVEVKYFNNASGDYVESNNGTNTVQTTAGTSGYISVWPGSSVTIMLIGTSPKVYRVTSQVGKVTYN